MRVKGKPSGDGLRLSVCLLLAGVALATTAAPAPAHTIVVGSPLEGEFKVAKLKVDGTYMNAALADPDANVVSPVDGAVLSYAVASAAGSTVRLRVLSPQGGSVYEAKSSTPWWVIGETPRNYTPLRIETGDAIAVDITAGSVLGVATRGPEAAYAAWVPALIAGNPLPYVGTKTEREIGLNAVVLPAPTISRVVPKSVPAQESKAVRIYGDDFQQVSEVRFGNLRPRSYRVVSRHLIVAKTPQRGHRVTTRVRVETVAGKSAASPGSRFEFEDQR